MTVLDTKKTMKAWYKFALDTVKMHRFVGGHRNNRAYHAELLNSAHYWLTQLQSNG